MSDSPTLIVMGRIGVDLYPLQSGPLENVKSFGKFMGGSAANVAVAAARLGENPALVSRVGNDQFGRYLLDALGDFGVRTDWVSVDADLQTPITFAELDPPEDPGLVFYRWPTAPDLNIGVGELPPAAVVRDALILWVTGTGLSADPSCSTTLSAMRQHRESAPTSQTILDLDWREKFWPSAHDAHVQLAQALTYATTAIGNRTEVAVAIGRITADGGIDSDMEPTAAAAELLELGVETAVVKCGADGVYVATRTDSGVSGAMIEPVRVPVVCGLGAGDAFGGAFCHGLLQGWDVEQCVIVANAAGALVASQLACADAMPTMEMINEFMETGAIPAAGTGVAL